MPSPWTASRAGAAALALLAGVGGCVAAQFATVWIGPLSVLIALVAGGAGGAAVYWHLRSAAPRREPPTPTRVIAGGLRTWGLMVATGATVGAGVGAFVVRLSPDGAGIVEALRYGGVGGAVVGGALGFVFGALIVAFLAFAPLPSAAEESTHKR